ncbi:hypothetical protein D3C80_1051610 [compost metagenome]
MILPGRIALGVFTDPGKRLGRRAELFTDITERGTHHIAGHQHQANLMMVAKQRSQPLVIEQRHHAEQGHTRNTGEQLAKQFAIPDPVVDRGFIQQQRRHNPQQ